MKDDFSTSFALFKSKRKLNIEEHSHITYNFLYPWKKNIEFSDEDFLVFIDDFIPEEKDKDFYCTAFNLPYFIRAEIIKTCKQENLYYSAKELFLKYVQLSSTINQFLKENYSNVYFFCCIHNFDFCLVSSLELKTEEIKQSIMVFLENNFLSLKHQDESFTVAMLEEHGLRRIKCAFEDRKFIQHNPNYNEYLEAILSVNNIQCDSYDRKAELSLFSSLILKDLVEATHLYWMYESGEIRREISDITHIIFERDNKYFKFFNLFCTQADDRFIFHDWIWCLIFLTQTLLSSLNNCDYSQDTAEQNNFFGFVPLIIEDKKNNSEVKSLFTRHISRKFCHGFLIIPKYSIYTLPEYLPAYIHEFFHYIPPKNRCERNEKILKLVLNSVLSDLRNSLLPDLYDEIFELLFIEIMKTAESYGFDNESLFECDSMEFTERISNLCARVEFDNIYDKVIWILYKKYKDFQIVFKLGQHKVDCVKNFKDSVSSFILTFVMFFREIRSDISMCSFFDMGIKDYIDVLAKEPLFSFLPVEKCADSTIIRFGFVCRYLAKKDKNVLKDLSNWKEYCKIQIDELVEKKMSEFPGNDSNVFVKYDNLKNYIDEYENITIETNEDFYTQKGHSFLEEFVGEDIIKCWEDSITKYISHPFSKEIKFIYNNYINNDFYERLVCMSGFRFLFRDLTLFDSNLDEY